MAARDLRLYHVLYKWMFFGEKPGTPPRDIRAHPISPGIEDEEPNDLERDGREEP